MAVNNAADRDALQDLGFLVAGAFGPEGRAVLIQNPTGQLNITRSGFNILKSVYSEIDSPRLKIIMNSVETLHDTLGDGVKSFIFMVTAILKGCCCLEGPYRIVSQLGGLQSRLSQLSLDNVSMCSFKQNTFTSSEDRDCLYSKVIDTFLNTRFPRPVSSVLGPLLGKWIETSLYSTPAELTSHLAQLYRDFSHLCQYQHGSCKSVTESCIKYGYVISRRPAFMTKSGRRKVIVLTFHDSDADCGKFDALDIKCEVDHLLNELRRNKEASSDEGNEGILLITPVILSDLTLFNLRRANVAVIHGAPIDEVKYLFTIIARRNRDRTNIDSGYVVNVTIEQNQDYVLLDLPEIRQMFICAPTKELCIEYTQTCHRALKLIIITNQPTFRDVVVDSGGNFERSLHRRLVSKLDCRNNSVPSFVNRSELLTWHKEKLRKSEESSDIYQWISEAFTGIDVDVMEAVFQGMLAVPRILPQGLPTVGAVEPVALRVGILLHALGTVISLVKINDILVTKRPKNVKS